MRTTNPQLLHDFGYDWMKELVMQNMKNVIKSSYRPTVTKEI